MCKKVYCLLIVCFLLFLAQSTVYALDFTFDTDNQGWRSGRIGYNGGSYERLYPGVPADWKAELAGHQGVIYQDGTTNPEGRPYALGIWQDKAFMGLLNGKTLVADVYSTGNWRTWVGEQVFARWYISELLYIDQDGHPYYNMWVSKAAVGIDMNALKGWGTFSIEMKETNFFKWPNYNLPGTFDEVLKNYDTIGLSLFSDTDNLECLNGGDCTWGPEKTLLHYGAYATEGTATWALDNVRAVPEPSTLILLGGAGLIVLRLRRHLLRN